MQQKTFNIIIFGFLNIIIFLIALIMIQISVLDVRLYKLYNLGSIIIGIEIFCIFSPLFVVILILLMTKDLESVKNEEVRKFQKY